MASSRANINRLAISSDPVFAPKPATTSSLASIFKDRPRPASAQGAPGAPGGAQSAAGGPRRGAQQTGKGGYRALLNRVRKERLKRLAILSYIAAFGVLYVALLEGPATLFNFCSLALPTAAAIIWTATIGPVILLKAFERSSKPELSDSRLTHFYRLFLSLHAVQVFVVSFVASVGVWFGFTLAAIRLQEGATLGPFVSIKGRETLQYNERPFYLLYAQVVLGLAFAGAYVATERGSMPSLSSPDCPPIRARLASRLSTTLPASARVVVVSSAFSLLSYLALRWLLLPTLVLSSWGARLLRPRLIAVLRKNAALSLGVQWRTLMEGLVFVAVWEVVSALWEVYETHPREVVKFDKDPNRVLLDGLVDPRTQQMALLELDEIATSSPQGRKRIFSELKGTVKPFNAIASECLAIVGETYRIAESKGVVSSGAASAPAKAPTAPPQPQQAAPPHSAIKANVNVFQPPPPQSLLSRLLSSSDKPSAASSGVATAASASTAAVRKVPAIFQSQPPAGAAGQSSAAASSSSAKPAPAPASSTALATRSASSPANELAKVLPPAIRASGAWKWATETRWDARIELCLPNRVACQLAVDALSKLLAASLREDEYGVAQVDIPRTLESFVTCLEGLEALDADLQKMAKSKHDEAAIRDAVWKHLRPVQTSLSGGIALLLNTFGPSLHEMRFAPRTAKRLQTMISFA